MTNWKEGTSDMHLGRLRLRTTRCAWILALALIALPAVGAEIERIASFSAGDPPNCADIGPDIAAQPGGSFLLLSQQFKCPEGTLKVRSQRFDAAGRPLAPAVKLWDGNDPRVAPLPDGGFVAVSWFERDFGLFLPTGIGLHRLDALGRPIGDPIVVALDPDSFDLNKQPRLAVAPNGAVAVVWLDAHEVLRGQFFDAYLRPTSDVILLSTFLPSDHNEADPDVAFQTDGTALVVWRRFLGSFIYKIFGRRFSVTGEPLSETISISELDDFRVNLTPRVVARSEGGWAVGWGAYAASPPPLAASETGHEIQFVRLASDGSRLEAQQSLGVSEDSDSFALGTDALGNLLVFAAATDRSISGRLIDRNGAPASALINLSGTGPLFFVEPVLAGRSPGGFLAAWSGYSLSTQADSDLFGAILTPTCLEGRSAICLGPEGRYGVEVAWQIGTQSGTAKPLPFAGNVATFGLRNTADPDVTVLLSGTGSRDLAFAATTGAALEIRVTDKTTGMVRTFTKPAGRFASRRFLGALPSLSGDADPSTAAFVVPDEEPRPAREPAVGETCVPTSRALCLLGGRFRAELLAGQYPNPALAILRTDKSGAFALPRAPETPLVTLSMIDGRASNGKFWVYLGGLSSSGYRVRITDLSTGASKAYANPVGKLDSRADRTAF
ncbi:MAG: hypothetical protein ABJC13_11590 [Acidobacteriota bacterium]